LAAVEQEVLQKVLMGLLVLIQQLWVGQQLHLMAAAAAVEQMVVAVLLLPAHQVDQEEVDHGISPTQHPQVVRELLDKVLLAVLVGMLLVAHHLLVAEAVGLVV
jgi:hypothetical protein